MIQLKYEIVVSSGLMLWDAFATRKYWVSSYTEFLFLREEIVGLYPDAEVSCIHLFKLR